MIHGKLINKSKERNFNNVVDWGGKNLKRLNRVMTIENSGHGRIS